MATIKKIKMFCPCCEKAVFVNCEDDPCPHCGSEGELEDWDEEIHNPAGNVYEFFDSPVSPCDTVGGL